MLVRGRPRGTEVPTRGVPISSIGPWSPPFCRSPLAPGLALETSITAIGEGLIRTLRGWPGRPAAIARPCRTGPVLPEIAKPTTVAETLPAEATGSRAWSWAAEAAGARPAEATGARARPRARPRAAEAFRSARFCVAKAARPSRSWAAEAARPSRSWAAEAARPSRSWAAEAARPSRSWAAEAAGASCAAPRPRTERTVALVARGVKPAAF